MGGQECLFPGRWGGRVEGFAPRDYKLARIYGRLIRRLRLPLTFLGHVGFAPVQEILGHEDPPMRFSSGATRITTTEIYLHVSMGANGLGVVSPLDLQAVE